MMTVMAYMRRAFSSAPRSVAPVLFTFLVAYGCGGEDSPDGGDEYDAALDSGNGPAEDAGPVDSGPRVYPDPPPAPAWIPDGIDLDDTVGWRESTTPACSPYAGNPSPEAPVDIVAGESGVFLLVSIDNDTFGGFSPFRDGVSVLHNDGTGWVTWFASPREPGSEGPRGLSPPSGNVLWAVDSPACPLLALDGSGTPRCLFEEERVFSAAEEEGGAGGWLLVQDSLVRLDADGSRRVVLEFEVLEQPIEVLREGNQIYALTSHSLYSGPVDGPIERVVAAVASDHVGMAVESRGAVWVASNNRITRHVDGVPGVTAEFPEGAPSRLWHDGSVLYYVQLQDFGRVQADGGVEVLATVGGESGSHRFDDVTGDRSTGEVYLALLDFRFTEYECGPAMVIWFDGTRFRRF
jgi:hypothetical protein